MINIENIRIERGRRKEVVIHSFLFLCFVFLFWFLYSFRSIKDFTSLLNITLYALTYTVILLFNIHYLFIKLFLKRRYFLYSLITLSSFFCGYFIQRLIYEPNFYSLVEWLTKDPNLFFRDLLVNILTFIMFGGVGLAFKILHLWYKTQEQLTALENINLSIELQNLKNQVSPHYLFNTLNNLYVLSKTKPELAPEVILNLSDLIRYQQYSITKESVSIMEEIEYLKNLIQLEKIRKDSLEVNFNISIDNENMKIQPMILAPLVENAIKHGSQQLNYCIISIDIHTTASDLDFQVTNTKSLIIGNSKSEGTGIKNLERRLQIGYPDRYSLVFNDESDKFTAHLVLRSS